MGSIKRKMARNKAKRKKKQFEKAMKQQLLMFDKLGDECAACQKPFDKKSKEHATTWNVVIRKEDKENPVRLYCPNCWDTAQEVIASFFKQMEENNF